MEGEKQCSFPWWPGLEPQVYHMLDESPQLHTKGFFFVEKWAFSWLQIGQDDCAKLCEVCFVETNRNQMYCKMDVMLSRLGLVACVNSFLTDFPIKNT